MSFPPVTEFFFLTIDYTILSSHPYICVSKPFQRETVPGIILSEQLLQNDKHRFIMIMLLYAYKLRVSQEDK